MTESTILKYIDLLDSGLSNELIFTRNLSDTVLLAKVWDHEPRFDEKIPFNSPSYNFYFIKNESEKVIGAIQDAGADLHWVIIEEERKKGHLTKALKEIIIPYIFCYLERDVQRITISRGIGSENYQNSKGVALSLGFIPVDVDQTEFELSFENFAKEIKCHDGNDVKISAERFKTLRKRIRYASSVLEKVSDELLVCLGDDKGLQDLANEVKYINLKIEDLEWARKK
ncbi:MAG: hypothetical protein QNK23_16390 [Crocinitomicaceae bacterium]|nr:hypothetical protein [Crocinitomicaceae bacterium]